MPNWIQINYLTLKSLKQICSNIMTSLSFYLFDSLCDSFDYLMLLQIKHWTYTLTIIVSFTKYYQFH